jgi:hypothetical protein
MFLFVIAARLDDSAMHHLVSSTRAFGYPLLRSTFTRVFAFGLSGYQEAG